MSLDSLIQALATRVATECKSLRAAIGVAAPPGVISPYAGSAAPSGWLMCDGSAVSRTTYAALYAAVGTAFGAGDGSTTFNIPDTRARGLVGVGTGKALAASDGVAEASRNALWSHAHGHTASSSASSVSAGTPAGTLSSDSAGTPAGALSSVSAGTPAGALSSVSAGTPVGNNGTTSAGTPAGSLSSVSAGTPAGSLNTAVLTPVVTSGESAAGGHSHSIGGQANATSYTFASGTTNNKNVPALGDYNGHAHGGNTGSVGDHTHGFQVSVSIPDHAHTFTGSALGGHSHTFTGSALAAHDHTFTGSALPGHTHTFTGSAMGAHNHTFTGSAMGTHTHTFTGSAMGTHTHTITTTVDAGGAAVHPYVAVNYIIKT